MIYISCINEVCQLEFICCGQVNSLYVEYLPRILFY